MLVSALAPGVNQLQSPEGPRKLFPPGGCPGGVGQTPSRGASWRISETETDQPMSGHVAPAITGAFLSLWKWAVAGGGRSLVGFVLEIEPSVFVANQTWLRQVK